MVQKTPVLRNTVRICHSKLLVLTQARCQAILCLVGKYIVFQQWQCHPLLYQHPGTLFPKSFEELVCPEKILDHLSLKFNWIIFCLPCFLSPRIIILMEFIKKTFHFHYIPNFPPSDVVTSLFNAGRSWLMGMAVPCLSTPLKCLNRQFFCYKIMFIPTFSCSFIFFCINSTPLASFSHFLPICTHSSVS